MQALCTRIHKALRSGPLVLACVVSRSGSAPGAAGARMLVLPNGSIQGSLGGGRYEAEAISLALELLQKTAEQSDAARTPAYALFFALNQANDMDMICGGDILVLLELILPNPRNLELFGAAAEAGRSGTDFVFASSLHFGAAGENNLFLPLAVCSGGKPLTGSTQREIFFRNSNERPLSMEFAAELQKAWTTQTPFFSQIDGESWLFEPGPQTKRLHIFGAGHLALALARLAADLEFSSSVIDDRREFASPARFPHSRLVCPTSLKENEISAYFAQNSPGERDAIVIVTRGHAFDRDVLATALRTRAGYIGMIGSAAKRTQVYASLLQNGFSEPDLGRVCSPIGLAIGAETPEEIAVSIMAQLIQWRRGVLK